MERRDKEDLERDPLSTKFRETRLKLSEWHEAMVPQDIGEEDTKVYSSIIIALL